MHTHSPVGKQGTGAFPAPLIAQDYLLPTLAYSPPSYPYSSPTHRPRPSQPQQPPTVHSTASHASADAWQMPLHNKDRLFLVLLPSSGTPTSTGAEDWALLLSPKRERKGHRESTLFRLVWDETEKGTRELCYRAKHVDALALPLLARWLLLKIRPGQAEFFEDEFDGVRVVQDKEWGSREWVGSCVERLRECGLAEVPPAEEVVEGVQRWRVSTWERGGRARGEVVGDLRIRD